MNKNPYSVNKSHPIYITFDSPVRSDPLTAPTMKSFCKCNKLASLRCSQCQQPYCSREHQLGDWKTHKTICLKRRTDPELALESAFPAWMQYTFECGRTYSLHSDARNARMQRAASEAGQTEVETDRMERRSKGHGINMPVPFQGNRSEHLANLKTHDWPAKSEEGDYVSTRCLTCECKYVHMRAWYACGSTVERCMLVSFTDGTTEKMSVEDYESLSS